MKKTTINGNEAVIDKEMRLAIFREKLDNAEKESRFLDLEKETAKKLIDKIKCIQEYVILFDDKSEADEFNSLVRHSCNEIEHNVYGTYTTRLHAMLEKQSYLAVLGDNITGFTKDLRDSWIDLMMDIRILLSGFKYSHISIVNDPFVSEGQQVFLYRNKTGFVSYLENEDLFNVNIAGYSIFFDLNNVEYTESLFSSIFYLSRLSDIVSSLKIA